MHAKKLLGCNEVGKGKHGQVLISYERSAAISSALTFCMTIRMILREANLYTWISSVSLCALDEL